jgi:hypothetical protein
LERQRNPIIHSQRISRGSNGGDFTPPQYFSWRSLTHAHCIGTHIAQVEFERLNVEEIVVLMVGMLQCHLDPRDRYEGSFVYM